MTLQDTDTFAAPKIHMLLHNLRGQNYTAEIRFNTPHKKNVVIYVSLQDLQVDFKKTCAMLADHGLVMDSAKASELRAELIRSIHSGTLPIQVTTDRLGLQVVRENEVIRYYYVTPDTTVWLDPRRGVVSGAIAPLIYQTKTPIAALEAIKKAGTMEGWMGAVRYMNDQPMFILATLTGLAATLIRVSGEENGGIHIYGQTSRGKTSCLQAAASVVGTSALAACGEQRSLISSWNMTKNSVELRLAPLSGMPLLIDEVGSNSDGLNIYNLFSGASKVRMNEIGGEQQSISWNILMISTGEYSMEHHQREQERRAPSAGASVRMIDIPMDDLNSIYHELMGSIPQSREITAKKLAQFQLEVQANHGWLAEEFIKGLMETCRSTNDDLSTFIKNQVAVTHGQIVELLNSEGHQLSTAHVRALRRLAFILAIGRCAVDFLPFDEESIYNTVLAAAKAWLNTSSIVSESDQIISSMTDYVASRIHSFHGTDSRTPPPSGWPFYPLPQHGTIIFTKEQLERAVPSFRANKIASVLQNEGILLSDQDRIQRTLPTDVQSHIGQKRGYTLDGAKLLGHLFGLLGGFHIPEDEEQENQEISHDDDGALLEI